MKNVSATRRWEQAGESRSRRVIVLCMTIFLGLFGLTPAEEARGQESLIVTADGDVGIGTELPTEAIHVVSDTHLGARLLLETPSQNANVWMQASGGRNWLAGITNPLNYYNIVNFNNPGLEFSLDAQGNLTLAGGMTANGDLAIGTATPTEAIHVVSDTHLGARLLLETPSFNSAVWMKANGGRNWIAGLTNGLDEYNIFNFNNPGLEFRLTGSGNLTIGGSLTTGAGGTIPDYVFKPDYSLMPIKELGEFIAKNRHLPNVPSAAQIEERGSLNMSEMQMKLLEKVEELTLYVVQGEERLTALEKENALLRTQLGLEPGDRLE